MERLGPLDALFLHAEDGTTHLHIGSCAIFEGPSPGFDTLRALVAAKLPRLTRYTQKVRFVPGDLGPPVWVDDPHFDLDDHVHHSALPAPGDEAELENLMARLMSFELPRDRPLWETWIVGGVAPDRWALVSKVHHCMVDGVSGTNLMSVLLDSAPDAAAITSIAPPRPARPEPSALRLGVDAALDLLRTPQRAWSARRSLPSVRDVVTGLRAYSRVLSPVEPVSIVGPIGAHRRWAVARANLGAVRVIRDAFGGSLNDVALAVVTRGVRELLLARGDDPATTTLRTLVPVNVRSSGDLAPNNQVAPMIAELPVRIDDPVERLRAVQTEMCRLKGTHEVEAARAVTAAAEMVPPVLVANGVRLVTALMRTWPQRSVNTVTTNVRGPDHALYAAGRRMVEYLPFVPLAAGARVGVAIMSYDGRLAIGVTGDYDSIHELHVMTAAIEDEVADLAARAARALAA